MTKDNTILAALQTFAENITQKSSTLTLGKPEDQLRGPLENLLADVAHSFGWDIVCTGETSLPGRMGRPDYAVHLNNLLAGYVELKAPGVGVNVKRFKGHNLAQWKRFSNIPNILYTDGNQWALYRTGELASKSVQLTGDVTVDGKNAVTTADAKTLEALLRDFLLWQPFIPADRKGKIDLPGLANLLAPLCRMLRDEVADALKDPGSPLTHLARNWRKLLFPDASDEQFADAYAQTVTFALLLGRSEGSDPLTLQGAETALSNQHNLLSRALQVLTDKEAQRDIKASLNLLLRVIASIPTRAFSAPEDPWLYFYEDFLATYDPKLRKDTGAYYTPVEVVRCQVRLIDNLLVNRLDKPFGFADPDVITLDPAAGTGTYLLGVIEHALSRVEEEQGKGAVAGWATQLANNLYGFEVQVGPYAVTELRVSLDLRLRGASTPENGIHIYLTDTLESPEAESPQTVMGFAEKAFAEQHKKATQVKANVPVMVCLGNPPYDRHAAIDPDNKAQSGGWVYWGMSEDGSDGIFQDFRKPAIESGHGVRVRNLYNLYVYFWRWALWKVFEGDSARDKGIVSFITASSYLDGDAFCGMREHMRRLCEEIWILDLGGEGRGTRKTENVFAIQTPVAIAITFRGAKVDEGKAARVHYARFEGTRKEKLTALDTISQFSEVKWQDCPRDWRSPFRPKGKGDYFNWPLLNDLMPWQQAGAKINRTWPIGPSVDILKARWTKLLSSEDIVRDFVETRDRKVSRSYPGSLRPAETEEPLGRLSPKTPCPRIERYGYRSFDRQWLIADNRLADFIRPVLWRSLGQRQVFFSTAFTQAISKGPTLTATACVPDIHYFSGRGAKDIVPLYRTADASEANILPGLLDLLSSTYYKRKKVTSEDFAAYVYGILAHPGFTASYEKELETRQLRVPITKDRTLFEKVRDLGLKLLWLHTYGERFVPKGKTQGQIPTGAAKCTVGIPETTEAYPRNFEYNDTTQTLSVGGGKFAKVLPRVYEFEVSGLKVIQSWLKYRMKNGAGKKSSPLDDIRPERWSNQYTTELLELLWVLEATVAIYPEQTRILEKVVRGKCFHSEELPKVPEYMRKAPPAQEMFENL